VVVEATPPAAPTVFLLTLATCCAGTHEHSLLCHVFHPTGLTGEAILDLLAALNTRSDMFTAHASVLLTIPGWGGSSSTIGGQQQQQGKQQVPAAKKKTQLRCLKLGPPADDQLYQQQQQQQQQGTAVGWPAAVFDEALDLLHPEEPLMQHLQV
jgi:hypothetical protein